MIEVKYIDINDDIKKYYDNIKKNPKFTRICYGLESGKIMGAASFDIVKGTLYISGLYSTDISVSDLILRAMLYRAQFFSAAKNCEIEDVDLPEDMLVKLNIRDGKVKINEVNFNCH